MFFNFFSISLTYRKVLHVHFIDDVLAEFFRTGRSSHDASFHRAEVNILLALNVEHVDEHGRSAVNGSAPKQSMDLVKAPVSRHLVAGS